MATLLGQTGAYLIAMIGSTLLNTWLRRNGVGKDMAFFTTLYFFAFINYFVIGWVVRTATTTPDASGDSTESGKQDKKKK